MPAPSIRLLLALTLLIPGSAVLAKKIYKYTDANGVIHFTDKRPSTDRPVEETVIKVEHKRMVDLRIEGHAGVRQARAFNHLAGPAEVELSVGGVQNVAADPPLPLTVVMNANEERVLASLNQADPTKPGAFELAIRAVPGDPKAQPADVEYHWPLADATVRLGQGFNGSFSHTEEQSRYAIDLGADEGTPVLAARDGVVMEIEDDYYGTGLDKEKFAGRANVVRVLHSDGSMAVYAHLKPESVVMQPGRHVYIGQKLGESGNTGFSTGPHLHFCVQVNRGMQLVSVPFRMSGAAGVLDLEDRGTPSRSGH